MNCPWTVHEQLMNVHELFMNSSRIFMNCSWTVQEYSWTVHELLCLKVHQKFLNVKWQPTHAHSWTGSWTVHAHSWTVHQLAHVHELCFGRVVKTSWGLRIISRQELSPIKLITPVPRTVLKNLLGDSKLPPSELCCN